MTRSFFSQDALELAPALLGKLLVAADGRSGRIVEVEAYRGGEDPASHAFRGRTARNATMFGPPGHLYVYFTYGMHFCANVVAGAEGIAEAVLLRALEPVNGLDAMRLARWGRQVGGTNGPDRDLCRGPARLCQAVGIDKSFDGLDLVARGSVLWLADDGTVANEVSTAPRVGISAATELPWRFSVSGHSAVSRR